MTRSSADHERTTWGDSLMATAHKLPALSLSIALGCLLTLRSSLLWNYKELTTLSAHISPMIGQKRRAALTTRRAALGNCQLPCDMFARQGNVQNAPSDDVSTCQVLGACHLQPKSWRRVDAWYFIKHGHQRPRSLSLQSRKGFEATNIICAQWDP